MKQREIGMGMANDTGGEAEPVRGQTTHGKGKARWQVSKCKMQC